MVVWYFSAKPLPENSWSWLSTLVDSGRLWSTQGPRLAASLPSASHFYFNYVILGWLVLPMAPWHRKFPRSFYALIWSQAAVYEGMWHSMCFQIVLKSIRCHSWAHFFPTSNKESFWNCWAHSRVLVMPTMRGEWALMGWSFPEVCIRTAMSSSCS